MGGRPELAADQRQLCRCAGLAPGPGLAKAPRPGRRVPAAVGLSAARPQIRADVAQLLDRVRGEGGSGRLLQVLLTDHAERQQLIADFRQASDAEYEDLLGRVPAFLVELDTERARGRASLVEVEENEADLQRYRSWLAKIQSRDHFGPARADRATSTGALRQRARTFRTRGLQSGDRGIGCHPTSPTPRPTGDNMTLRIVLGLISGLALTWLALALALLVVKPKGGLLKEALRLLPDVIRLLKRLATDPTLPRGVRIRLALLFAYLAFPLDLIPDFLPVLGYADDAIIVAAVLRGVVRRVGIAPLQQHWPGSPDGLAAVVRLAGLGSASATG